MCPTFQKTKTQNVRVWRKEKFIDQGGANWEGGRLSGHFKKVQSRGFFYAREEEMRRSWGDWQQQKSGYQLRFERLWNFFVLSLLTLVDVSPVMKFPQIFEKHSLFLFRLLLSLWERHFLVRGYFRKTQTTSRISLMISTSICKPKQKLLAWMPWGQSRLEQGGIREAKHFTLLEL